MHATSLSTPLKDKTEIMGNVTYNTSIPTHKNPVSIEPKRPLEKIIHSNEFQNLVYNDQSSTSLHHGTVLQKANNSSLSDDLNLDLPVVPPPPDFSSIDDDSIFFPPPPPFEKKCDTYGYYNANEMVPASPSINDIKMVSITKDASEEFLNATSTFLENTTEMTSSLSNSIVLENCNSDVGQTTANRTVVYYDDTGDVYNLLDENITINSLSISNTESDLYSFQVSSVLIPSINTDEPDTELYSDLHEVSFNNIATESFSVTTPLIFTPAASDSSTSVINTTFNITSDNCKNALSVLNSLDSNLPPPLPKSPPPPLNSVLNSTNIPYDYMQPTVEYFAPFDSIVSVEPLYAVPINQPSKLSVSSNPTNLHATGTGVYSGKYCTKGNNDTDKKVIDVIKHSCCL